MNKIGIYFAYWEKNWSADYCDYVRKVKALGFDVLEVEVGALADKPKEELLKLADTSKENNIDLTYCIGLPPQYDLASADEKVRKNGTAYVGKLLDTIHVMGGNTLGGIIYSCWPSDAVSYDYKMAARERSVRSIREVAKKAEEYGIDYCLEIVNRFEQYIMNTAEEGIEFVNEVGSKRVKLLLDTFHMNIEEDSFRDAILTVGDKLGHFHIGECNRKVPGRGHMAWDEIMGALKEINYTGKIVMEPFVKPGGQVGKDIRVYRELSGGANVEKMDAMAKESLEFIRSKNK